jgi:hypothetical protein
MFPYVVSCKRYFEDGPNSWLLRNAVCKSEAVYRPRRAEDSALYAAVSENLETFLQRQRQRSRIVPRFLERDLHSFLECEILAHGFVRVHRDACGTDRVILYSCKSMAFCPDCGGRRMAETAAPLVDHVFSEVPVRQWVLSVPFLLRYRLTYDASLARDVLQIFVRTVFSSIRRRAGIPASNRKARCGAVAFIRRFSDALNLDPHFHVIALGGIYLNTLDGEPLFRRVDPPTDAEVTRVAERVRRRVARLMDRRGIASRTDPDEDDTLRRDEPLLAALYSASISGRTITVSCACRRTVRVVDEYDFGNVTVISGRCCASTEGFSIHPGVCVPARDRFRLEHLLRYAARPRFLPTGSHYCPTAGFSTGSSGAGATEPPM